MSGAGQAHLLKLLVFKCVIEIITGKNAYYFTDFKEMIKVIMKYSDNLMTTLLIT